MAQPAGPGLACCLIRTVAFPVDGCVQARDRRGLAADVESEDDDKTVTVGLLVSVARAPKAVEVQQGPAPETVPPFQWKPQFIMGHA